MTYKGTVINGVVVLPPEAVLPDGAEVEVNIVDQVEGESGFLRELLKLSKERDWPDDFALNHSHYMKGHPEKS
jgi:hypothetical protein